MDTSYLKEIGLTDNEIRIYLELLKSEEALASELSDKTNVNQVSVRASNSAGLVTVNSGSSLTAAQNTQLMKTLTVAKFLGLK